MEPQTPPYQESESYLLVVSAVAAILAVSLAFLAATLLRLGHSINLLDGILIGLVSLAAAWLAMRSARRFNRKALVLLIGSMGTALCLGVCWWVYHTSNFELTAESYQALNAARVPADLIAELKNAEGSVADTDQQFVADLAGRFGQDHIAPYRDALVQSCWNCHQRIALAALLGFCICFCLTVGASLAPSRALMNIPGSRRS